MFKGYHIADIPVILGSIDPCFACTDRTAVILLDIKSGTKKTMTIGEIKKKYWRR